MRRAFPNTLIIVMALALASAASAATSVPDDKLTKKLSDRAAPGSSVTYDDLLRLLFTDFSDDSTPTKTRPLRHVSGDHEEIPLTGQFDIYSLEAVTIRDKSGPIVVVELDLRIDNDLEPTVYAGEASIIAAYRLSPRPRLLDALDIKTDRFTGLIDKKPVIPIGPNQDAFVISNNHFNSSENYDMLTAFFFDGGKLKPMFDLFIFNSRGCGFTFDETVTFSSLPDPGKKYFKVGVTVLLKQEADESSCVPRKRGFSRTYRGTYAWNPATRKFRPTGGNLGSLDKFNRNSL